jgi:hypothetical protein
MERNIVKMAIRKTLNFILAGFLVLFIYAGSYHSFCECFLQTCPIHSHASPPSKSICILQGSAVADIELPNASPNPVLIDAVFALPTGFFAPLNARSPPYETFPPIIASRYQG